MDIQAVTFDVGGTLIEPWPSVGHIYAEVAARHGHKNLSSENLNRQFAAAWQTKRNFDHSRAAWRRLVEQTFAGLTESPPSEALFDDLYQRFAEAAAWRVFDDVRPALEQFQARKLRLGIISNWDERLRPLLRQLQLDHYFAATTISIEAGFTKPHVQIFRQAAAALGLPTGSILHVGDNPIEDLAGAQAAGMRGFLLNRRGSHSDAVAGAAGVGTERGLQSASPSALPGGREMYVEVVRLRPLKRTKVRAPGRGSRCTIRDVRSVVVTLTDLVRLFEGTGPKEFVD